VSAISPVQLPQAEAVSEEPGGVSLKLLIPALLLLGLGVAMVFSASIPLAAAGSDRSTFHYLWRELAFVGVGLVAMVGASRLPMEWVRRSAGWLLLLLGFVPLVLVLFVGIEVNGSRAWLPIPGTSLRFQPSEVAKIVLVLAAARHFARFPKGIPDWHRATRPFLLLALVAGLVAIEPDLGTATVLVVAMMVFFHIAGAKLRHLAAAGSVGGFFAAIMLWRHPYQLDRIRDYIIGGGSDLGAGWQKLRSLIALGSGGVTGCGYCGSAEKYFYLPAATTDSILAVIGEELGMIATWAVVGLFAYLVWQGLSTAGRAGDRFSGLVAAGVVCLIGIQAIVNIAVVTGSIPATGVPLPLVSYGGSSLVCSLIAVGLLLNVSRNRLARRPGEDSP
jgi:cell division protein FtsW